MAFARSELKPLPQQSESNLPVVPAVLSLAVHVLVLLAAGMTLKGCREGVAVEAGGQEFRTVGLAVIPDDSQQQTELPEANSQPNAEDVRPVEAEPTHVSAPATPNKAPSVAELLGHTDTAIDSPNMNASSLDLPNIIGPGIPIGGSGGGSVPESNPPGVSGMGSAGSPTPGPGETAFMDIIGNGKHFAYVIDVSASMGSSGKLDLAKSQLKGSLRLLQPNQTFQVLFYNESTSRLRFRNRPRQDRYQATLVNRKLAEDRINSQGASGGTEHLAALTQAMVLSPDVIYFLTDGGNTPLTSDELDSILASNQSGARIHVVEFAVGPRESRRVSWLQILAHKSGGEYRRINLTARN